MSRFGKIIRLGEKTSDNLGKVIVKDIEPKALDIPKLEDVSRVVNSNSKAPVINTPRAQGYGVIKANKITDDRLSKLDMNPLNALKTAYDVAEEKRKSLVDYLADKTTSYLPEVSKQAAKEDAKVVLGEGLDPMNYIGGAGAVDAALSTSSAALPYAEKLKKLISD